MNHLEKVEFDGKAEMSVIEDKLHPTICEGLFRVAMWA
jgi:hypothetical protein